MRVIELETRAFQRLDIVNLGAIQVQHAGLIDKNFQISEIIRLIQHVRLVFERHRVAEPGAPATNYSNP